MMPALNFCLTICSVGVADVFVESDLVCAAVSQIQTLQMSVFVSGVGSMASLVPDLGPDMHSSCVSGS